jgi:hypothetical protein
MAKLAIYRSRRGELIRLSGEIWRGMIPQRGCILNERAHTVDLESVANRFDGSIAENGVAHPLCCHRVSKTDRSRSVKSEKVSTSSYREYLEKFVSNFSR